MLVVNFFGGPSAGKSTTAAQTFGHLKMAGYNAELVTEFAKDLTWDKSLHVLGPDGYQPYVFTQQAWRIVRLRGQVDIVVNDSPMLMSLIYAQDRLPACFFDFVEWEAKQDENINFMLRRVKPYNTAGRTQTEEEAREIDVRVAKMLEEIGQTHELLTGDGSAPVIAFSKIVAHIAARKAQDGVKA